MANFGTLLPLHNFVRTFQQHKNKITRREEIRENLALLTLQLCEQEFQIGLRKTNHFKQLKTQVPESSQSTVDSPLLAAAISGRGQLVFSVHYKQRYVYTTCAAIPIFSS